MWSQYRPMGFQPVLFAPPQPFRTYPWQGYLPPGAGLWPMPGVQTVGSAICYSSSCPCHSLNTKRHTVLGALQSTQSLCFPYMVGGIFFPGLVPPNDMVNSKSVVGIKPADSGVVIRYQADEY